MKCLELETFSTNRDLPKSLTVSSINTIHKLFNSEYKRQQWLKMSERQREQDVYIW